MEVFNLEKHWDDFRQDKVAVNCSTEELANEFLQYCERENLMWGRDEKPTHHNNYNSYKEDTCYESQGKYLYYGRLKYFSELADQEYKIVQFQGFKRQPEPKPQPAEETIKVIYHNSQTIVLIQNANKLKNKNGKTYAKGVARCHETDTYNREYGFLLAYQRARAEQLGL